jgi:hypothetical protein
MRLHALVSIGNDMVIARSVEREALNFSKDRLAILLETYGSLSSPDGEVQVIFEEMIQAGLAMRPLDESFPNASYAIISIPK